MTSCLLLAAGNGTRMRTDYPKVLAEVLNVPMLAWVLGSVIECGIKNKCVVTGYASDKIKSFLELNGYDCETSFQSERRGTAHAVMSAREFLNRNLEGDVLILGGDSPFIDAFTITSAYKQHKREENAVTIISADLDNPFGYGRIIRNSYNDVCEIVEEREANKEQKKITEINSGAYWFNVRHLLDAIGSISASSLSGELYLTSIVSIFIKSGFNVGAFCSPDCTIALGANTPEELEKLNDIAKRKLISSFISRGVKITDFDKVSISKNVEIGEGTTILSDVIINSFTKIGRNCTIGPGIVLSGEVIPDNTNLVCLESQNYRSEEVKYAT